MSKILTQPQAEAVHSAMCTLNNVAHGTNGIALSFNLADDVRAWVRSFVETGEVHVTAELQAVTFKSEEYADMGAFATAYGLAAEADKFPSFVEGEVQ